MANDDAFPNPLPPLFREVAPTFEPSDPYDAPSLRWGIIGAGGIARKFATDVPAYSSQVVAAVASRDLDRARAFAAEVGIPEEGALGSYEELVLSDLVDVIYVATPHNFHHRHALLALEAGKPVLVEKAFSMSAAQTREIFAAAKAQGLFAMEAMWSRHLPHYHFIREAIASGRLGKLLEVHADHGQALTHVRRLMDPNLAGGAMLDLGVYPISFVQMALGVPQTQSALARLSDQGIDLGDVVIGKYADALSVVTCKLDSKSPTSALLSFEYGYIELPRQFYRPTKLNLALNQRDKATGEEVFSAEETWDSTVPGGFQYQVAEAARCIADGKLESEACPWSATLEVSQMMDSALADAGVVYP